MQRYWRGGLVFLLAVLFLGCTVMSTLPKPSRVSSANRDAAEIEGIDATGTPFKLSDYRGKVVLVDFWFKDCPWCVKMHEEDRILIERYKDKPFVLLGVNTDRDVGTMRQALAEQNIIWRCWWDETGEIAEAWSVTGFPTLVLIDPNGKVRKQIPGMTRADVIAKEIDKLLP